jgi:hypothetical protein
MSLTPDQVKGALPYDIHEIIVKKVQESERINQMTVMFEKDASLTTGFDKMPCATRLLPVLIGSGGTLSPAWSEQPIKIWTSRPMPTNMPAACYLPSGHEE